MTVQTSGKGMTMNILDAIEDRRARLSDVRAEAARLEAELATLEEARDLVAGILNGSSVKPPPRARKERAVRAEPKPTKDGERKRTLPGDKTFAKCGHPNVKENQTGIGRCRTCKNTAQLAYLAKKSGKTPKAKPEEDPAPVAVFRPLAVTVPAPLRPAVNAVAAANAAKWQRQCPMLDVETGKRCSLMTPHAPPHSASGRTFTNGLNPTEFGGSSRPRELDAVAVQGGGA